jgi:hypothetical protein
MHDTELEQRLRATLRDEADRLPLRVDVERLEAAVALRRRSQRSSRFGLMAAAVGAVAFGVAAIALNTMSEPARVGASAQPAATPIASVTTAPASPLPAGLTAFEPRPGGTVLAEAQPTWSGDGTTRTFERSESTTSATSISVACVDPTVVVAEGGEVTELAEVQVTADGEQHVLACMPDSLFGLTLPLTDRPSRVSIDVPAGVAWTALVETVPVPAALPAIDTDWPAELEGSSDVDAPDWNGQPGVRVRTPVGTIDEGFSQEVMFACLGPGTITIEMRAQRAAPDAPAESSHGMACLGEQQGLSIAVGAKGLHEILVEADARTAWAISAASVGDLPPFTPPALQLRAFLEGAQVEGGATPGLPGCHYVANLGNVRFDEGCDRPEWPAMGETSTAMARSGGTLQLELGDDWQIDEHVVRAAPYLQTGKVEPPVNIRDLESTLEDGTLVVPLDLSNSRWLIRVDLDGSKGRDSFETSYFYVLDVRP